MPSVLSQVVSPKEDDTGFTWKLFWAFSRKGAPAPSLESEPAYWGDVALALPPGAAAWKAGEESGKASGGVALQTAPAIEKLLLPAAKKSAKDILQGWRGKAMEGIEVPRFALPDKYTVTDPPIPLRGELSLYFCMSRFLTRAFRNSWSTKLEINLRRRTEWTCEDLRASLLSHLRKSSHPGFLGGGESAAGVESRRERCNASR